MSTITKDFCVTCGQEQPSYRPPAMDDCPCGQDSKGTEERVIFVGGNPEIDRYLNQYANFMRELARS